MLKKLRNSAAVWSVAAILSLQISLPRARAIVAVASWNPVLMGIALGVATGGSLVGVGGEWIADIDNGDASLIRRILGYPIIAIGALAGMGGMILLDGTASQQVVFAALSPQDAQKLGVSPDAAEQYNSELDQANAISQNVTADLREIDQPTLREAVHTWEKYESLVSPATFLVMGKITMQMVRK